jgi:hypothetical protein
VLQQIRKQFCIECFRDRNRARSIAFGFKDHKFAALTVHICNIKLAQLVGPQPTTIKQPNDQAITSCRRSGHGCGLH